MRGGLAFHSFVTLVAASSVLVACREPDLSAVRSDLETSAAIVCEPPPARPPHGTRTHAPGDAELDAALAASCAPEGALDEKSFIVVREALAGETAAVGRARRSQMALRAPRADDVLRGQMPEAGATTSCDPSSTNLERKLITSATGAQQAGQTEDALERCGDALALTRDWFLDGSMIDVMLAISTVERFITHCKPILDAAPKETARAHARTYRALRAGFPSDLRAVATRDRHEMVLFQLGALRDRRKPLPCKRATALASANDTQRLTRRDRAKMVDAWNTQRSTDVFAGLERYEQSYRDALGRLDAVIAR